MKNVILLFVLSFFLTTGCEKYPSDILSSDEEFDTTSFEENTDILSSNDSITPFTEFIATWKKTDSIKEKIRKEKFFLDSDSPNFYTLNEGFFSKTWNNYYSIFPYSVLDSFPFGVMDGFFPMTQQYPWDNHNGLYHFLYFPAPLSSAEFDSIVKGLDLKSENPLY